MKKMTREPDHFEIAAMRTLSKVNKMGSHVNVVTIGPNSTYSEKENINEPDETKTITSEESSVCGLSQFPDDQNENLFLYAAKALREMETLRQLSVADNVNERISKLMKLENELKSKMTENLKLSKEEINIKNRLQSKIMENSINNDELVLSRKMYELIKKYMDDKLKNEEKMANDAKIRDEEIRLKNERIQCLSIIQQEFNDIHNQILDITTNCKNRAKLISQCDADFYKVQDLTVNLSNVLQKVNLGSVEDQDVETCQIMLRCLSVIADRLKNNADLINIEDERLIQEQQVAQIQDKDSAPETVPANTDSAEAEKSQIASTAESENDLEKYVCKELLEQYRILCDRLNEFSKHVEAFVANAPSKHFLRVLKIAIKTPLNAVSSIDRDHMRDTFVKISHFLRGNFTLPGVPMPNRPNDWYSQFVVDYLCKHFIFHAENRFNLTARREAYLLASLALAIWSEFPEFGQILIANIMKKCPYAIPAYWPRYNDQTDQEYYVSLGYKFNDDAVEDEQSFTTRMTGIFMFYVSLMVTPCRRNQPHPYGIENAWRWIAGLLNLEPRSHFAVVTAELLYVFLHTCGYSMSLYYGIQFRKIVELLIDEYIPKIEKITPDDFRGPVSRLKLYIVEKDVLRKGFREPKELLCADDWL